MIWQKYHALGNDYLVLDPGGAPFEPSGGFVRSACHRNLGLGSDGILLGPLHSDAADFGLRIFNPDGSEAEKSGNGLRIFCQYLEDSGKLSGNLRENFRVETPGGIVTCAILESGLIRVEMGKVSFHSQDIPVSGAPREVLQETIDVQGQAYSFCAATVGNPHCVLPLDAISPELVRRLGPHIEMRTDLFPNRTNVQLLKVLDRRTIQIEIWERGAGYTLASGSSSCAAGAVARKLGLVDAALTVRMPGGHLELSFDEDFAVTMTGPATRVARLLPNPEALQQLT